MQHRNTLWAVDEVLLQLAPCLMSPATECCTVHYHYHRYDNHCTQRTTIDRHYGARHELHPEGLLLNPVRLVSASRPAKIDFDSY